MTASVGVFPRIRTRLFGARDEVAEQMREIAQQGSGMARIAHLCGFLMIILFSLGSAVGIGASLVESLSKTGVSLASAPDAIALSVSVMLVLCMDVGSLYASFMVRLLATRRAPKGAYAWHIGVIIVAAILESGTFAYMSYKYDLPTEGVVWALIIGRAVAAPLFAIYLNMARPIPVGVEDMLYRVELNSGMGVIRGTVILANDPYADVDRGKLGQSIEMYRAAAVYSKEAGERLDKVAALFQDTQPARIAELPAPITPWTDRAWSHPSGPFEYQDYSAQGEEQEDQAEAMPARIAVARAKPSKPRRSGNTPRRDDKHAVEDRVRRYVAEIGRVPSITELERGAGISASTASWWRRQLRAEAEQLQEAEA